MTTREEHIANNLMLAQFRPLTRPRRIRTSVRINPNVLENYLVKNRIYTLGYVRNDILRMTLNIQYVDWVDTGERTLDLLYRKAPDGVLYRMKLRKNGKMIQIVHLETLRY